VALKRESLAGKGTSAEVDKCAESADGEGDEPGVRAAKSVSDSTATIAAPLLAVMLSECR
jgi:hypothetical protein